MATIKKPVMVAKSVSVTPRTKQIPITSPVKKLLKPDTVTKKSEITITKTTSLLTAKVSPKSAVSKITPSKGLSKTVVEKSNARSLTPKSDTSATVPSKSSITKPPLVKRAVADSTSSAPETAIKSVRKSSMPSGLANTSMAEAGSAAKPVAISDSKPKTSSALDPKTTISDKSVAAVGVKTIKSTISINKSSAKPVSDVMAKLPKAKATITLPLKTSPASTSLKLTTTTSSSVLAQRASLVPKKTDLKKPPTPKTVSTATMAKSVSKPATPLIKPPSIKTPILGKKVIQTCTDVQICHADSTSPSISDDLEMEMSSVLDFGTTAARLETTTSEFSEMQAYKVAEQMMEVLGTAVVTNESIEREDSSLNNSAVIDGRSVEAGCHESAPIKDGDVFSSIPLETGNLKNTTTFDCEPQVKHHSEENCDADCAVKGAETKACNVDFNEDVKSSEEQESSVVGDGTVKEMTSKLVEDRGQCVAESVEKEDEKVALDDSSAVINKTSLAETEMVTSNDENNHDVDDGAEVDKSFILEAKHLENQEEIVIVSSNVIEEPTAMTDENAQTDVKYDKSEDCPAVDKSSVPQNVEEVINNDEILDNQRKIIGDYGHKEEEIVLGQDNSFAKIEVCDETPQTDKICQVIDEMPSTEIVKFVGENVMVVESSKKELQQLEQLDEMVSSKMPSGLVNSITIQEDHFGSDASATCGVNLDDQQCNSDGFVIVKSADENTDGNLENSPPIDGVDNLMLEVEQYMDNESVSSADSIASYADIVKEPASIRSVIDFEDVEVVKEADPGEKKITFISENKETSKDVVTNVEGPSSATMTNEEVNEDDAEGLVHEQNISLKVEVLLVEPMADEVQQMLDAGTELVHNVEDEEGYEKVQKKRNKQNNKRNRKSFKAFKNENADSESVNEIQGNCSDDNQMFQKRRNSRRTKHSTKKHYRRNSEPYTNSHRYAIPVWKSFYVE